MLASLLLTAGLLLAPRTLAAEAPQWDFSIRGLDGWQLTHQLDLQPSDNGLVLRTVDDTVMLWTLPAAQTIDGLTLLAAADRDTTIQLVWHNVGAEKNAYQQFPALIKGGGDILPLNVGLSDLPGYNSAIDRFGFNIPAGSTLILKKLTFERVGLAERLSLWWRSFWTFDRLTMRSINFLWGPRLAMSQPSLETLYETEPAGGASANWFFYGAVGIGLVWSGAVMRRQRQRGLIILLAFIAGSWIAYDLRMGAELLQNTIKDYRDWVGAPADERTLRKSADAFRVLEELPGALEKEQKYALLMTDGFSEHFFRYATYPALPVTASGAQVGLRDWVVFHRPDVRVINGRLVHNGVPITGSGTIVRHFSTESYLFRTNP